jgi:hypothetical protein
MPRLAVLLLAVLLLTACGNQEATSPGAGSLSDGTIRGRVLAGPSCPVESAPADGSASDKSDNCADRPAAARVGVTSVSSGSLIATVHSDTDGRFEVDLPGGQYELQALELTQHAVAGPPLLVNVRPGVVMDIVVHLDTGIR